MVKTLVPIDYVDEIDNKILSQYKNALIFKSLISSFSEESNIVEGYITTWKAITPLAVAEGENLNKYGRILGVVRGGNLDDDYRDLIYLEIAKNYSEGTPPDIYALWSAIIKDAATFKYIDIGNGSFRLYLRDIVGVVKYDIIKRITKLGKVSGVTFLPILVSPTVPIFSFSSDIDVDGEGFTVKTETVIDSYSSYVYPLNGAITDIDRITFLQDGDDFNLTFHLDTTNGPLFETELLTELGVDGGIIKFNDALGAVFEFVSDGTVSISSTTVGDSYRIAIKIVDNLVVKGALKFAGVSESFYKVASDFSAYDDSNLATFNTNNTSGLVNFYSNSYTADGGHYSIIII